jgi:hypothetical protein
MTSDAVDAADIPPTRRDALILRSPDAVVSALPYLLGFAPRESVVALWLAGGRLLLTQRLDLPAGEEDLESWLEALFGHGMARVADELIVVVVTAGDRWSRPADALLVGAADRGIAVRDALLAHVGRWRSLLCDDPRCCPPEGRPIDAGVRDLVAAEFTVLGIAPLAERSDLEREFATDPEPAQAVTAALIRRHSARPRRGVALDRWRDEAIDAAIGDLIGGAPSDECSEGLAGLLAGMRDIRVRDTVLWEVSRCGADELAAALDRLSAAVRSAPAGLVAPVAASAAIVAWLLGDGARAVVASDRALADDPRYSLAVLVRESLRAGLPPESWRAAMAGLSRDACRQSAA